jgi:pimeloyl-ACP methyl ester carboxylesterase
MQSPPGRLVSIGTHHLHLHCAGDGSPAVVFDAALGGSSLSWSLVHPHVARITRACVYDRAGFGWSDAGPIPRTAGRIADELHRLLHEGGVPPPYVLVGHSFGGMVMRIFAARHPAEIAGIILIEPAVAEDWVRPAEDKRLLMQRGARLCKIGAAAARLGVASIVASLVRGGVLSLARLIVTIITRGRLRREDENILAPIWKLPPEARPLLGAMWTQPKFFGALGSQIGGICDSAAEVLAEADSAYGDLPLAVITAAEAGDTRLRSDAALAARSSRGRHVLAPGSGHWVPLDAPRVVIDTVVDMVDLLRSGRREWPT